MCEKCTETNRVEHPSDLSRRKFLLAGATLAAAPVVASAAPAAKEPRVETGPFPTRAWAASSSTSAFAPIRITRRALGPHDVLLDVLYAGICHSDLHAVHGDWRQATFPIVPGHEIVGRVRAVGSAVTRFRIGDVGGVGCMVDSCGTCENCLAGREQNCLNGTTFTYDSEDRVSGGRTHGGYSERIVVSERFVIRIPPGAKLAATTPLLCAGITTFSPLQHWKLEAGQRLGVVGLGGLGHVAVKLGVARKADVTIFTTSPGKVADARRLGAREAVLWSDREAMKRLANHFDLIISTVPVSYPMQPFMDLLKLDATLVNVGALGQLEGGLSGMALGFGRKSLAGSMIGGIAETQQVIDYCAARNIAADVELIGPQDISRAYERIVKKDVRYRFVIDLSRR
jgi:uncharacterized zinc-type alcohol dehydrogenase-like protein